MTFMGIKKKIFFVFLFFIVLGFSMDYLWISIVKS